MMSRPLSLAFLISLLVLTGCGGGGSPRNTGEIAGTVVDADGNPVRDAVVRSDDGRETRSNSFGSYRLERAQSGATTIRATVTRNGTTFRGANVASVFEGDRTMSVNIAVYPQGQLATLIGGAVDRSGNRLAGVRIFARPQGTGVLSSQIAITDQKGNFRMEALRGDQDYDLIANARGYGDDLDQIRLSPGETRNIIVTLGNPINTAFQPPTELSATAYTSPREVTRDARNRGAAEALKRELDPKRTVRHRASRDSVAGDPIEVELTFTPPFGGSLLGYGIYRGPSAETLRDVGFLRDPLAEIYTDSDQGLREQQSYTYALTSLSTSYPDTQNSESDFSNAVTVETLGSLSGDSVSTGGGSVRFDFNPAAGSTRTAVFLFTEYPRIGVSSVFNTFEAPATGSSYIYDGPALSRGRTYYYLLLGLNADGSARSISRVGQFVAP